MISDLQYLVVLVLAIGAFAIEVFALVEAIRTPAQAFKNAGKLSREVWLTIVGVGAAVGFLALPFPGFISPMNFLAIIAAVAAIIFVVDVRPAVAPYRRRPPRKPQGW
ncbi:DUF2516 family protein [Sanguibacter sp. HDW7]|uniref:DUF2516 family protein n=1 Tax=Sanguibacter sp. HDW7 TaxID=2714931 RepID=UPI00140A42BA|nr:DUF2516 family protein [Sanguibacter sp. HDW7]QIK82490.1 DUF2516 family protein [Sanguibacter sp. HDW7]